MAKGLFVDSDELPKESHFTAREKEEMNSKTEIRKRLLSLRNSLSTEQITAGSSEIVARLMRIEEIRKASTLMVYLSFGSEVRTDDLIRWCWGEGKRIVVPFCHVESRELTACRIDGFDELETGHYGIRAPKEGLLRPVRRGKDRGDPRPRRGLRPKGLSHRLRRRLLRPLSPASAAGGEDRRGLRLPDHRGDPGGRARSSRGCDCHGKGGDRSFGRAKWNSA